MRRWRHTPATPRQTWCRQIGVETTTITTITIIIMNIMHRRHMGDITHHHRPRRRFGTITTIIMPAR